MVSCSPSKSLKAKRSQRAKSSKGPAASLETLKIQHKDGVKKHLKAERTIKTYLGHVARGRDFLDKQCDAATQTNSCPSTDAPQDAPDTGSVNSKTAENNDGPKSDNSTYWSDPEFAAAFSDKPNKYSPEALVLYLTQKGFVEECSQSTVDGIYSAFKDFWTHL